MRQITVVIWLLLLVVRASGAAPPVNAEADAAFDRMVARLVPKDLLVEHPPLPDEHNAWSVWLQAAALLKADHEATVLLDAALRDGPLTDAAAKKIRTAIARHGQAATLFEKGLKRKRCRARLDGETFDLGFNPQLGEVRKLVNLRIARSKLRRHDGEMLGAARDALDVYDVGNMLSDGDDFLIDDLVGVACKGMALRQLLSMLQTEHPATVDRAVLQALDRHEPLGESLANQWRTDLTTYILPELRKLYRHQQAGTLNALTSSYDFLGKRMPAWIDIQTMLAWNKMDEVAQQRVICFLDEHVMLFDLQQTLRVFSEDYAPHVQRITRPWPHLLQVHEASTGNTAIDAQRQTLLELFKITTTRMPTPDETKQLAPRLANVMGCKHDEGMAHRMTGLVRHGIALRHAVTVTAAAHAYRSVHGQLPDSLNKLIIAGFIKVPPLDPFGDGTTLMRYDAKRGLVWSVGQDGKDDDGQHKTDDVFDEANADYVWRIAAK